MLKQALMVASVAALALASPAHAKNGKGKGHKGHGYGQFEDRDFGRHGYGLGGCPPGLAKKTPRCVPPGQAKHLFNIGQRVPFGYRGLLGYDALPYDLRSRYGLDPYSRYIYRDDYLYRVDPRTHVVSQILSAIL